MINVATLPCAVLYLYFQNRACEYADNGYQHLYTNTSEFWSCLQITLELLSTLMRDIYKTLSLHDPY